MYGDEPLWHAAARPARRPRHRRRCARRSTPARRPSSCSTRGPGTLSPADYRALRAAPLGARCSPGLADLGVPRIHFGVGTGELLGADGRGRRRRGRRRLAGRRSTTPGRRLGAGAAVQGNLDPAAVPAPVARRARPRSATCWPPTAGRPGPHLQPRPRRAPRDRPGRPRPRRRAGARAPRCRRRERRRGRRRGPVAVLLMAYGTPGAPDDVEAYYTDIRRGRPPTPEQLADLVAPLRRHRRHLAAGRAHRGAARRRSRPPSTSRRPGGSTSCSGMKHAAPSIEDAVGRAGRPRASTRPSGWCWRRTTRRFSVGQYLDRAAAAAEPARRRPCRRSSPGTSSPPTSTSWPRPCADGLAAPARRHEGAVHRPLAARRGSSHRRPLPRAAARHGRRRRRARPASRRGPTGASPGSRAGRTPEPWLGPDILRSSTTWPPPRAPPACWCAPAASSPTTSRCSTTSTSRPAAGPTSAAWPSPAPVVNDDPSGDGRPGRPGRRPLPPEPRDGSVVVVGGGITGLAAAHRAAASGRRRPSRSRVLEAGGPPRRQDPHHAVRRPAGGRRGRRRVPRPGAVGRRPAAASSACDRPGVAGDADGPTCGGTGASTRSPTAWCSACPPAVAAWPAPASCPSAGRARAALEPLVPRGRSRTGQPRRPHPPPLRRRGARAPRRPAGRQHQRRRHGPPQPGRHGAAGRGGRGRLPQPPARPATPAPGCPGQRRRRPAGVPRSARRDAVPGRCPRRAALGDVRVLLGQPVEALEPAGRGRWLVNGVTADAVLLALPAPAAARLLAPLSPDAEAILAGIGYASVAMVTPGLARERCPPGARRQRPPRAQAGAAPRHRRVVGVDEVGPLAAARPGRPASIGGPLGRRARRRGSTTTSSPRPRWQDLDTQLGLTAAPTAVRISRWPRSFPQYAARAPGPHGRAGQVAGAATRRAVGVAGAAVRGLGLPACIRQGTEWPIATMRRLGSSATMG